MIITVTPNPALDITYTVERLVVGDSHRVRTVKQLPGGKGVNVARVLHALGRQVVVAGLLGGFAGDLIATELGSRGIQHHWTSINGQTRRCVAITEAASGQATVLNEPGPTVTPTAWTRLYADIEPHLSTADVLVCSGSLPPGSPADAIMPLIQVANGAGVPTIVDSGGPALLAAMRAGPSVVKPNYDELTEATGVTDPVEAAHALRGDGHTAVVASLGPAGLVAVTDTGTFQAQPSEVQRGNPTGAGDAVVATLAAGLHDGHQWPDILRHAAALGSATVLSPVAGEIDTTAYEHVIHSIDVKEL